MKENPFFLEEGGLHRPEVQALLQSHLGHMAANSPPESRHVLDLDGLRQPDIDFWTVWRQQQLAGCVALKHWDHTFGELKSMKTADAFVRQGVAQYLLDLVIAECQAREYQYLMLETGSMAYFEPARQLYLNQGFVLCEPFGHYHEDPNNVFMSLQL
jgi:putative acetyltransferase